MEVVTDNQPKELLNQEEINKKYTEICGHIGHREMEIERLKVQINYFKQEVAKLDQQSQELAKEKAAIEKHNKEVEAKKAAKDAE